MKTLTRQDILNKVWNHFITKRRAFSIGSDGMCKYRNGKGAKCGIGCLFPDSLYDPAIEGLPVRNRRLRKIMREIGINTRNKKNMRFLSMIQLNHDSAARTCSILSDSRQYLKKSLSLLAEVYKLTISSGRKKS